MSQTASNKPLKMRRKSDWAVFALILFAVSSLCGFLLLTERGRRPSVDRGGNSQPEMIHLRRRNEIELLCWGHFLSDAAWAWSGIFFGGWGGDIGKLHWENIRPWWGQPSRSLFVHANTATVTRPLVEDTRTASWSSAGRQIEQKDCKRECLSGLVLLSIEHSVSHSVI